jgi:hypothetical protein
LTLSKNHYYAGGLQSPVSQYSTTMTISQKSFYSLNISQISSNLVGTKRFRPEVILSSSLPSKKRLALSLSDKFSLQGPAIMSAELTAVKLKALPNIHQDLRST